MRVADPADPAARRRRLARSIRRRVRRYRRWVGAGLLGLSVLMGLSVLAPPPAPTEPLLVAARDLPAGHVLDDGDLAVVQAPPDLVPAGSLSRPAASGQVLNAPLGPGEPITATRVRYASLLAGAPEGRLAVPVRVADPGAAELVVPGDRIDLMAAIPGPVGSQVRVVGRDLPVLAADGPVMADAESPGVVSGLSVSPQTGVPGGLLVVAASPEQASAIVASGADGSLWLAVRGSADVPLPSG